MPNARRSAVDVTHRRNLWTISLRLASGRLSAEVHAALVAACEEIDLDQEARGVVLRSRGRDFCLGDDETVDVDSPDGIAALGRLRVPCIAVLDGAVLDAGLELALACDFRVAAVGTRLGLTQARGGALPRHGGTQRLPRIVGPARAARLLLLGDVLSARQALAAGLVQEVCARDALARTARRLETEIVARAPIAQRLAKEALRAASDLPLAEGLRLEGDLYVLLQTTEDRTEGIASFHEKRKPRFKGR